MSTELSLQLFGGTVVFVRITVSCSRDSYSSYRFPIHHIPFFLVPVFYSGVGKNRDVLAQQLVLGENGMYTKRYVKTVGP